MKKKRMALSCSKKLSALFYGTTTKHKVIFYCFSCLHSLRTENKLKTHQKICKNKDFCGAVMPSEMDEILEFIQSMKSDKLPFIIYANIKSLVKKVDGCANNPENSSVKKIGEHIPCGYSLSTISEFDQIEDKPTLYRGKDCMKKVCTSLSEHAKNIIDFEKKKMLPLTKEELKSHQDAKLCHTCGKRILKRLSKT